MYIKLPGADVVLLTEGNIIGCDTASATWSGAKGNAEQPHMRRTQSRESMSQRLSRVREAAKQRKKERFTALFHLLTVEALEAAFLSLSRKAAAGVDGIRWMDYAGNMKNNITDLHRRLHQGSYRAQPGRRHYIPKADGKQRPLGIASLEDKIVQYALVKILNAVYENDFMGFSYGFRASDRRPEGNQAHT